MNWDLGDIIASSHFPERSIGVPGVFTIPWGLYFSNPITLGSRFCCFAILLSPCMSHLFLLLILWSEKKLIERAAAPFLHTGIHLWDLYAIVSLYDVLFILTPRWEFTCGVFTFRLQYHRRHIARKSHPTQMPPSFCRPYSAPLRLRHSMPPPNTTTAFVLALYPIYLSSRPFGPCFPLACTL